MAKELELPQQTLKKQTPQALALPRKSSDIGLPALPSSSYPVFSSCLPVAVTHNLVPFFGSLYSLFSPLKCNLQKDAFPSQIMSANYETVVIVQSLSHIWHFATPSAALQHLGLPCLHFFSEFAQTLVHWVGDAIQPSHPPSPPSPPAFNLSQHQGLSDELALRIRWQKYSSFSFSISPSNEYSGMISFRTDWFGLFAV